MVVVGYTWLAVAVLFIASTGVVLWLVHRAPVGEPDRSRLDDFDQYSQEAIDLVADCRRRYPVRPVDLREEEQRLADRIRFEQMLHPSAGNGLCDLEQRRSL